MRGDLVFYSVRSYVREHHRNKILNFIAKTTCIFFTSYFKKNELRIHLTKCNIVSFKKIRNSLFSKLE